VGVVGLGSVALGSGDVCQRERVDLIWDVAGPVPIYRIIPISHSSALNPASCLYRGDNSLIPGIFLMRWFS